jgi:hypothetical protein
MTNRGPDTPATESPIAPLPEPRTSLEEWRRGSWRVVVPVLLVTLGGAAIKAVHMATHIWLHHSPDDTDFAPLDRPPASPAAQCMGRYGYDCAKRLTRPAPSNVWRLCNVMCPASTCTDCITTERACVLVSREDCERSTNQTSEPGSFCACMTDHAH